MDFGQYLLGERLNKLTLGNLLCVELSKLLLLRPAPAPSPHHPQTRAQWPHHPRREWSARVPRYPPPYSPYRSPRGPHRWDCCGVSSPGPGSSGTWGLHPRASGRRPGFHPQTVSKQTTEQEAGVPASSGSCSLSPTTAGTPLHLASKWEPSWFGHPPRMPAAEGLGGSSVTSGGHKYEEGEGHAHLAPKESPPCLCSSSCDAVPDKAFSQHVLSCYRATLRGLLWLSTAISLMVRDFHKQDVSHPTP